MAKKYLVFVVAILAAASVGLWYVFGQKTTPSQRLYKIALVVRGVTYTPGVEGFKAKMKELGYEEGKNVIYLTHFVEKREELPAVIRELLTHGVDLIHTYSTPATVEAYSQTKTIPIVFGSMGDPLASKTIQTLERSGTNVTGVSSLSAPLAAKRLEFLLEASPAIKRVAFPFTPDDTAGRSSYESVRKAAEELGVDIVSYSVSKERDARQTAAAIRRKDVDGIVISSDSAVWAGLDAYVNQALKEKLPFAVFDKDMVAKGGLLGYGPDYFASGGQSALLAHKILQGQNPTDLPIEAPQKLILALNIKTARAIGLTFPTSLLKKADVIIEER